MTASPAAARPCWCPGATRARTRCTGSGGPCPPALSGVSPKLRAPTASPCCHETRPRTRRGGTTGPARRPDRPSGLQALPDHLRPELAEAGECGQAKASEGSVRHVEVFRLGGVGIPILGSPRLLCGDQRADPLYTLSCEAPLQLNRPRSCGSAHKMQSFHHRHPSGCPKYPNGG